MVPWLSFSCLCVVMQGWTMPPFFYVHFRQWYSELSSPFSRLPIAILTLDYTYLLQEDDMGEPPGTRRRCLVSHWNYLGSLFKHWCLGPPVSRVEPYISHFFIFLGDRITCGLWQWLPSSMMKAVQPTYLAYALYFILFISCLLEFMPTG